MDKWSVAASIRKEDEVLDFCGNDPLLFFYFFDNENKDYNTIHIIPQLQLPRINGRDTERERQLDQITMNCIKYQCLVYFIRVSLDLRAREGPLFFWTIGKAIRSEKNREQRKQLFSFLESRL